MNAKTEKTPVVRNTITARRAVRVELMASYVAGIEGGKKSLRGLIRETYETDGGDEVARVATDSFTVLPAGTGTGAVRDAIYTLRKAELFSGTLNSKLNKETGRYEFTYSPVLASNSGANNGNAKPADSDSNSDSDSDSDSSSDSNSDSNSSSADKASAAAVDRALSHLKGLDSPALEAVFMAAWDAMSDEAKAAAFTRLSKVRRNAKAAAKRAAKKAAS